jgi:hypothetical protein
LNFLCSEVRLEIDRGQIFVNLCGEGPGVSAMMGPIDEEIPHYSPEGVTLDNGINFGVFEMRAKRSNVPREQRCQELIGCTDHRFAAGKGSRWLQVAMNPNMGIEYYPDLFVLFQVLPLGSDKSLIKATCYSPPDLSAEEREMQAINLELLDEANGQDKVLVERIQRGVRSSGYEPGPLALAESSVYRFHEYLRERIPDPSP